MDQRDVQLQQLHRPRIDAGTRRQIEYKFLAVDYNAAATDGRCRPRDRSSASLTCIPHSPRPHQIRRLEAVAAGDDDYRHACETRTKSRQVRMPNAAGSRRCIVIKLFLAIILHLNARTVSIISLMFVVRLIVGTFVTSNQSSVASLYFACHVTDVICVCSVFCFSYVPFSQFIGEQHVSLSLRLCSIDSIS
jgi:hypothetical protein